jgi:hypothetical protein
MLKLQFKAGLRPKPHRTRSPVGPSSSAKRPCDELSPGGVGRSIRTLWSIPSECVHALASYW